MGFERNKFLNVDSSAEAFLSEWYGSSQYITANTSGSTGIPKPIRLLKSDMIKSAEATINYFGIKRDDYLLCPLSCRYIAGKMMAVRGIVANATVDFNSDLTATPTTRIKLTSVVPAQLDRILCRKDSFRIFENLLIGGSPLPESLEVQLLRSGLSCHVSFGMTETCSHVALRRCGEKFYRALPGFSFSADLNARLIISSNRFSFCPLTTNDIVEIIDDKTFRWIGRFDNAIISGGIKVFPEIIERKISPFVPSDITFYVTSTKDPKWGEAVVIVSDRQFVLDAEALLTLSPAERPKMLFVEAIQRTASGKIKRISRT